MKALFSILALFLALSINAQNFEGTLTYKIEAEVGEQMKNLGVTMETLKAIMEEEGVWTDSVSITYKNNYYVVKPNNKVKTASVYQPDSNMLFSIDLGADICTVQDMGVDLEQQMFGAAPKIYQLDTTVVINGKTCNIIRVRWQMGQYDYYYAKGVNAISPDFYAKHKYDGFAGFLAMSKALPMRVVKRVAGSKTIMTLVETKLHKVDDSIFELPDMEPDDEGAVLGLIQMKSMKIKK